MYFIHSVAAAPTVKIEDSLIHSVCLNKVQWLPSCEEISSDSEMEMMQVEAV